MSELPRADEPRPDRCETCRFWMREKAHDEFHGEAAGYCKRYPPRFRGEGYDFGDAGAHLNPTTMDDDWCGEWQAKNSQTKKFTDGQLSVLTPVEWKVIKLRHGIGCEPCTLEETGIALKLTRERVRQLEKKAMLRMGFSSGW